ncbi:trichothecene 3-o-acetyltransferase [Ophiostoma piceae UAMH 11346]|uniref:Trichothecene 3-o-acetyltransferase n=1 Tax=Ophiostoma piceae (strain UAMH 11346) TaxID=1262450 RepID=S3CR76_OPHP1|nr:trichothecene 3-o-acetyltransferase [Ophiostoma piceae UAMH 11346]
MDSLKRQTLDESSTMDIGVFGQQPGIQIYTQITYIFAIADDSAAHRAHITRTLTGGLGRLGAAFPWTAGQVVLDDTTARYRFAPIQGATAPDLCVADARSPDTFAAMEAAGFPFSMLDEDNVASRRTFPGQPSEAHLRETHVFMVMAGFIPGGLLLTFTAHHAVMDMAGQGEVIRWLSKACRGDVFTEEECLAGNCARLPIVPVLGPDEGGSDPFQLVPEQIIQAAENDGTEPTQLAHPVKSVWSYFEFSAASLAALKKDANATLPRAGAPTFVSTNDAYTAFVWQSIVRARLHRLDAAATPSTFARAIDMRHFLGVSPSYPGLLQNMTIHTISTVQAVVDAPLGEVAARLRSEIDKDKLVRRTRALATCYSHFPDKAASSISFVGAVDTAAGGFMLSSWASVPSHTEDMDFGLGLGVARAVRRPAFTPVEGLGYLMPQAADGSIAAGLCLREADLQRLRDDPVFLKYGKYAGQNIDG